MGTMNNLSYLTPWVCGSCRNAYMASWEISCWHCGLSRAVTSGTLRQDKHKKLKAPGYSTPSPSPDKYSKARSPNHYASLPEQDKNKSSKTTGSYDIKQIMAEYRDIFRNVTRRFFLSPDDYREALEFGTEAYRVCLDIINVEHAVAVDLLSCMCMLDRRGIPRFLFSQSDNKSKDFTNAVRVLMDMSLVTENEGSFFEMHYLVQLGTKRRLEVNGDFQKRAAEVLALLSDQFPTDGYASLESYEVLEPHVQALLLNELSSSPRCRLQRARILHNSAWYATEKGSCVIGENRAQQAVDVRMELLGKDHEDTLSSQRLLAVAYRYQGKWREAEELELTISNPKNGALGGECPDPRVIMINSTTMYWDRGQSKEVENLDLQVMTPSMKASDKGHSNKVLSLANLLSIYSQQGRWEEAEEVAMQVMKTTARVLGVEHPDTLTSMVDLLWIYASRQGRRKEAFALGKELTNAGENIVRSEAQHEALPVPTPDFLVFRSQEWLRRAEKLGVQVIDTSWLEFGYVHPATVAGMINLMLIYRKQGKLPELLQLEARILTTSKRVEDPYMLMYLGHLTWTSSLSRALQLRAQKATEMFLKARTLKSQASFSTIDTKSALIEANEVKLNANTMASGTTSVEANSLMPEFSRHSVKDLLEIPVDLPRTESILTLSKSLPVEIIETQQEKFREHPSEPFDEKKRDIHLLTGFGSDNEGFLRNDTVPLKSFSADAFGSKIPEKSSLYLSKSYDERNNVHPDEDFALNGAKHHQKESISSKKPLVGASTFMEVEKSTQYLSKSYDDRSNVKPRKRITSNNETFLQLGSRPSGSYSTSGFHARRREKPPKYSSELFDTKRLNVHLRTASGSDNEGPVRDGSISSVIDVKRIEEPVKCKVEPPEPCAPDTHPHLGADPNFQGDSLRGSFLPIFDARKIKGQTGRDSFPSKLCAEKKRSVHGSQNLENKPAENVKLFVSNKNENFSTTKVKKVTAKMDAERRIGNFLAQHSDLKPLYEEALRRMDKDRFVDHVRKLLKQYFLDLSEDAKTDPDRATSHLLQDELSRIRIARHIADSFNSEYNEIRGQIGQYMHMTGSKVPDLDAWIAGNADPEAQIKAPKPEPLDYISNDDDEAFDNEDAEGENRNRALIPNAVELENTLIGGRPFQNLCMNLEFLLLPASLGSLTRILMSIPNDRIWFSAEDDLSFSNKMKTFMEDHTEENWYWWPLQPRMRVLRNSQTRLHWRCHCGMHLWTELSILEAKSYQSFLRRRKKVYQHNHLCGTRKQKNPSIISMTGILQAAGSAFHPDRWYGSSRSSSATSPQATRPTGVTGSSPARNTQLSAQRTATSNQPAAQTTIDMPQIKESFVLFGVKGTRRTLELAQINARKYLNDNAFFGDMRKQYRELRGFLRYWFSIWRFSHCDFVKFEKIRANRIIPRGKEIPTDMNYEYKPRPPHAEDPPISPHEFELAFSSCGRPCILSSFHDCIEAPDGDFAMERIPKRKSALQLETGTVEFAWGIQAQHAVSFVNLAVYHFLILAATFGFWAWWQTRHPGDIQNAAVPLTTVTVLLSMFWSSAGLLKVFR